VDGLVVVSTLPNLPFTMGVAWEPGTSFTIEPAADLATPGAWPPCC